MATHFSNVYPIPHYGLMSGLLQICSLQASQKLFNLLLPVPYKINGYFMIGNIFGIRNEQSQNYKIINPKLYIQTSS